eukprot:361381-Chlamydomonas_euryale.AAC.8
MEKLGVIMARRSAPMRSNNNIRLAGQRRCARRSAPMRSNNQHKARRSAPMRSNNNIKLAGQRRCARRSAPMRSNNIRLAGQRRCARRSAPMRCNNQHKARRARLTPCFPLRCPAPCTGHSLRRHLLVNFCWQRREILRKNDHELTADDERDLVRKHCAEVGRAAAPA